MSSNISKFTAPDGLTAEGKKLFKRLVSDYSEVLLPRHSHGLGQLVKALLEQTRIEKELAKLKSVFYAGGKDGQDLKLHPLWQASKEADKRVQDWMDKLCLNPVQEKKRAHETETEDEDKDPYSDLHKRNRARSERSKSKS